MAKPVAIMLAPNGARLTQADHPSLPVSIGETVAVALDGKANGAQALHAHVRDANGQHVLDESLYRTLLEQTAAKLGNDFPVQITTEAVGRYTPDEQISLVRSLKPRFCSVALRELIPEENKQSSVERSREFYHWAYKQGIGIQHILYGLDDVHYFLKQREAGNLHHEHNAVLIVLGRYGAVQLADIDDVLPVAALANENNLTWMLCAFGHSETDSLVKAMSLGGHARIGFENSREHRDGSIAADNSERVKELIAVAGEDFTPASKDEVLTVLGQPI